MVTRHAFFVIAALIGWSLGVPAQACKPVLTIVVTFDEGSAALSRDQVVSLANSLDQFRRAYPHLDAADIEGVARETAPDARQLARSRAAEAARAVRVLFNGVKLHTSSNVYPPQWSIHDGNYAAIGMLPPMKDMPDCTPVPIPGFKY